MNEEQQHPTYTLVDLLTGKPITTFVVNRPQHTTAKAFFSTPPTKDSREGDPPDLFADLAQTLIQEERARRTYQVTVARPTPIQVLSGVPIPRMLRAYRATTTCTVLHPSGQHCIWEDYALLPRKGAPKVILHSDLAFSVLSPEETAATFILEAMAGELRELIEQLRAGTTYNPFFTSRSLGASASEQTIIDAILRGYEQYYGENRE